MLEAAVKQQQSIILLSYRDLSIIPKSMKIKRIKRQKKDIDLKA